MLMPVELIGLWTFLALLSCGAVCAYVWQRRSAHTPRAPLTAYRGRGEALLPLSSWDYWS